MYDFGRPGPGPTRSHTTDFVIPSQNEWIPGTRWAPAHRRRAPAGNTVGHVWRGPPGGIANAGAYQLWPSAVGRRPQDNALFTATYP